MNIKKILKNIKKYFLNKKELLVLKIMAIAVIVVFALIVYFLKFVNYYPLQENLKYRPGFFGVTFSTEYATSLGLNWKNTYQAILGELQVKEIRIPIYWDQIEKKEGVYDFSKYDYLVKQGEKHHVKFILSIGRRVPRWPECHGPDWLKTKKTTTAEALTLQMITTVVNRYKLNPSVEYWQVENEPFLATFGICPPLDKNFLKQEFKLVHSLDPQRQIIITGSGEMSSWRQEAQIGDIFGSTLYRVVYDPWFGYLHYPLPTSFYRLKAKLAGLSQQRLMVLELQAEPWVPHGNITAMTPTQINKSMSVAQFKANLQYAINLNFRRTYLWGVEWWYFEKQHGNPAYWNIAKTLFK